MFGGKLIGGKLRGWRRREVLRALIGSGVLLTAVSLGLKLRHKATTLTKFANDPHRPQYHFLPPANWMNDPNGLIQWQGEYHLFYQHNPAAPVWGNIHWGHAVSSDLVHWRHLPLALAPTPGGPDADGCWSGCALADGNVPTVIYTGAHDSLQVQCLARSLDGLQTWTKDPSNPVLAQQPGGTKLGEFRDPFVWRQEAEWLMVLGAALDTGHGAALLYRSTDLQSWEYLHPLLQGTREDEGWMWECPNFFPLQDKHVLLFSNGLTRQVFYVVGRFDGRHFLPVNQGVLSADHFYAPLTFADDQGRRIMIGWIDEPRPESVRRGAGWAGLASLPRLLGLDSSNRLTVTPISELQRLRGQPFNPGEISSGLPLSQVRGDLLELEVEFALDGPSACGLAVRSSADGTEETVISYSTGLQSLIIDRSRASLSAEVDQGQHVVALPQIKDRLHLRIFVDRSVLEVFVRDGPSISTRIYPTREDSVGVRVFFEGHAEVRDFHAWTLTGDG